MKKLLYHQFPDFLLTIIVLVVGGSFWIHAFTSDMKMHDRTFAESFEVLQKFPILLATLYVWTKTLLQDTYRIINKQQIRSGLLYMFGVILLATFYFIYDSFSHIDRGYYNDVISLWIVLDIIALFIFEKVIPKNYYNKVSPQHYKSIFEAKFVTESTISLLLLMLSWFFAGVIQTIISWVL